MKITLNLASRPYADLGPAKKRLRIGMGALTALCIVLALGLHLLQNRAETARNREHSLDGRLAQVTAERQGYIRMMQQPDNAALLEQVRSLNDIFDQKAFSWTLAMENLETVLPGGVMVTTLEPVRAKTGEITLHLRVVGPRDLGVDLVRNLEHSKRFVHPRIVGENSEASANGSGMSQRLEPISASNRFDFDLLAEYNPPTLEERAATKNKAQETPAAPNAPATTNVPSAARRRPAQPGVPHRLRTLDRVHPDRLQPDRVQPGNPAKPSPAALQPQGGAR